MARRQSLLIQLAYAPWWVSIVIGAFVYILASVVLPMSVADNTRLAPIGAAISKMAWLAAIFLLPATASLIIAARRRWLFDS